MPSDSILPVYPVPAELDDPRFQWLFRYWLDRHRDGRLPGRAQIDPVEFPHLLGRIHLIEVVRADGRIRFRFRLWGSMISDVFAHEHTGHWLEEVAAPGTLADVERFLMTCTQECRPQFWRRPMLVNRAEFVATRRLLLPLAADGETVDMLIGLILEDAVEQPLPDGPMPPDDPPSR